MGFRRRPNSRAFVPGVLGQRVCRARKGRTADQPPGALGERPATATHSIQLAGSASNTMQCYNSLLASSYALMLIHAACVIGTVTTTFFLRQLSDHIGRPSCAL